MDTPLTVFAPVDRALADLLKAGNARHLSLAELAKHHIGKWPGAINQTTGGRQQSRRAAPRRAEPGRPDERGDICIAHAGHPRGGRPGADKLPGRARKSPLAKVSSSS